MEKLTRGISVRPPLQRALSRKAEATVRRNESKSSTLKNATREGVAEGSAQRQPPNAVLATEGKEKEGAVPKPDCHESTIGKVLSRSTAAA